MYVSENTKLTRYENHFSTELAKRLYCAPAKKVSKNLTTNCKWIVSRLQAVCWTCLPLTK